MLWPVARLRVIGGGAWLAAAALAVTGSLMPFIINERYGNNLTTVNTWEVQGESAPGAFPPMGVVLVVCAVMLVIAGGLGLISTRLHPASGLVLTARLLGTAATTAIAASSALLIMIFRVFEGTGSDAPLGYSVKAGLAPWLLIGSSVVGLAGIVLMLVPKISHREEPATPPLGIPVVRVLEPDFESGEPEEKG
jgi:hypothetical protein